jgi:DNA polymerase
MSIIFYDIETRSACNLEVAGAPRYAADPTTEILSIGFAVNNDPVIVWTPGEPIPSIFSDAELLVSHNDQFERAIDRLILGPRYGWPQTPISRRRCTMSMALASALPGSLQQIARILQLPHQKDMEGQRLMLRMARPSKARSGEDPNSLHWIDDPESLARLHSYLRLDVETMRAAYYALPQLSPAEQVNCIRRLLALRREGGRAAVRKLDALFAGVDADGRVRGTLRYHAAATGRWSGNRFQPKIFHASR